MKIIEFDKDDCQKIREYLDLIDNELAFESAASFLSFQMIDLSFHSCLI